jgi:hypothetical protein
MKPYLGVLLWVGLMSAQNASHWVYFGKDHRLEYRADAHGNRIVDFSYAGYRGGGVRLPNVPRALGLAAVKGDNTHGSRRPSTKFPAVPRMPTASAARWRWRPAFTKWRAR